MDSKVYQIRMIVETDNGRWFQRFTVYAETADKAMHDAVDNMTLDIPLGRLASIEVKPM